ncbi:hypothetical protein ACFQ8S_07350 [Streptomyces virginiae]|uniref:hypothetical protein n=1 Tax=Streptomyces virginiae TaxID=1961 RepID=UPI003690C1B2
MGWTADTAFAHYADLFTREGAQGAAVELSVVLVFAVTASEPPDVVLDRVELATSDTP